MKSCPNSLPGCNWYHFSGNVFFLAWPSGPTLASTECVEHAIMALTTTFEVDIIIPTGNP